MRPVRMTTGRALTHVQPETASQILCQVVNKDGWVRLLGGPVGRYPAGSPDAACMIASDWGSIALRLYGLDKAMTPDHTIAGRPASSTQDSNGGAMVTVALTDDALRPAPRQYRLGRPLLELKVISTMSADIQRDRATRILAELLPLLAKEGDPLPTIDDLGKVHFSSTPMLGGGQVVDLPQPVQGLQLCTALQEAPGIRMVPTRLEVDESGRCQLWIRDGLVAVSMERTSAKIDSYPDKIAGRPARRLEDRQVFNVRLRDDVPLELMVSAPDDAAGLAAKLVPLLLS